MIHKAKMSFRNRMIAMSAAAVLSATAFFTVPTSTLRVDAAVPIAQGIDVSHYQGAINWTAVANSGIKFAFVRVGTSNTIDTQYINNLKGAAAAGLRVGVYWYTYATTPEQVAQEANLVVQLIAPYQISYPVVLDLEAQAQKALNPAQQQALVNTFCSIVHNAGYMPMVYASRNWYAQRLGDTTWQKWVAQYSDACTMPFSYGVWQYTSHGAVPGIGTRVDMDYLYTDYSSLIIPEGFLQRDGKTYYFANYRWQKGWVTPASGGKYFCDATTGAVATGWMNDGTYQYYLDPAQGGKACVGVTKIGNDTYYFNADARETTGLITVGDGMVMYFAQDGKAQKGFVPLGDGTRYFADNYLMLTGLQTIGKDLYYLGNEGIVRTGFVGLENGLYYFDAEGKALTGFFTEPASKATYYFAPETHTAKIGLASINKKLYYFNEKGVMQTGMLPLNGGLYLFGADGAAVTGFFTDPSTNKTYYFDPASGKAVVGATTIGKSNYIFDANGVMQTGFIGGYYYGPDGKMVANQMFNANNLTFMAGKDGRIQTGIVKTKNGTYAFDAKDGHMLSGFVQIKNGFYFFGPDGKMVKNTTAVLYDAPCTFDKTGKLVAPANWMPPAVVGIF